MRAPADEFSISDAAREAPERPALVIEDATWSFAQLASAVAAHAPPRLDWERPTVASRGRRDLEGLLDAYTAFERGVPLVPVHPRWTDAERTRYRARLAESEPTSDAFDDLAVVLPTSGSTGLPKGVALSRPALGAAVAASADRLGWARESAGSRSRETRPVDGRWLLALPMAHIGGLSIVLRCLAARATVVVWPEAPVRAVPLLDRIERQRITVLSVVPTMLARLVEHSAPPSLRQVLVGGAAAPPSLLRRAAAGGWPVLATYGLTEAASQVATEPWAEGSRLDGTCGPLLDGFEARLGPRGALVLRGPALFSGYLPASADPFDADGWFRTGDLACFEGDSLRILGRADDVIVSGGENLFPAEIEAALLEHPALGAVCVVGVDDASWGQTAAAVVELAESGRGTSDAPDTPPTLEGLAAHLAPRLARFKHPRRLLVVEALPKTSNGKIDRRAVAALAASTREETRP